MNSSETSYVSQQKIPKNGIHVLIFQKIYKRGKIETTKQKMREKNKTRAKRVNREKNWRQNI